MCLFTASFFYYFVKFYYFNAVKEISVNFFTGNSYAWFTFRWIQFDNLYYHLKKKMHLIKTENIVGMLSLPYTVYTDSFYLVLCSRSLPRLNGSRLNANGMRVGIRAIPTIRTSHSSSCYYFRLEDICHFFCIWPWGTLF